MAQPYDFMDFQAELENINQRHFHRVFRPEHTIERDKYALHELLAVDPLAEEQYLEGWARSYYSGQQHLEAIFQYAHEDIPLSALHQQTWTDAIQAIRTELRSLPRVRAFSVLTELDQIDFQAQTAAGYDYQGVKGDKDGENHRRAISRAKATLWSALNPSEGMDHVIRTHVPDVGYTRTQLTNLAEKLKVRGVWGRAFHYILLEGTAANPLIQMFQTQQSFFHIGMDPTVSVPRLLSYVKSKAKWLIALDWQAFDASVNRFEIDQGFDLLKELVFFPDPETETAFEISRQLFKHKKIAAPDGNTYWSHKGLPSGSYYTMLIGSIVNRLRIEYLWRVTQGHGPIVCFTQGDDSLSGDNSLINPEDFAQVSGPLGWTMNPAKTEISTIPESVTFLGRSSSGGLNQRDIIKCLRLLIYPEVPVTSGDISAFRATSIAQDVGGTSSRLNEVARKLRRKYGIAEESKVPRDLRRYFA
uniref:RNA-dependent RNA polymerase n=1 Tax=Cinnamomum chago deltapartitivirus 2 TaxID=2765857 RepID=A0A8D9PH43_9VIRU|nr:TPA_exp: RNA-dependent RNA polymerase [Cinnamomum chago deltapartitivirus 2]